jgi:transposase
MKEVTIIGVDLAKRTFQVHGAAADGSVVFRRKLSRSQLLPFLARQPACTVAMEACATSHHWGREIAKLGHVVKAIPPIYVKPFVKRQKNDAADAEAIAEAASRPTMRFVALKTEQQQARAMIFRARDLLVRQRTQLINALRGHLAEYGVVAAQGIVQVARLQEVIEDPQAGLPSMVRDIGRTYLDQIGACSERIVALEKTLRTEAAEGSSADS